MHIHTHGSKGDPVIIILHPMGITGEKMYEVVGTKFRGEYYFITPDMSSRIEKGKKAWCVIDKESENVINTNKWRFI